MSSVLTQKLLLFVILKFVIYLSSRYAGFRCVQFVIWNLLFVFSKIRSNKVGFYGESPKLLRSNS
jgi:hypothetical protein